MFILWEAQVCLFIRSSWISSTVSKVEVLCPIIHSQPGYRLDSRQLTLLLGKYKSNNPPSHCGKHVLLRERPPTFRSRRPPGTITSYICSAWRGVADQRTHYCSLGCTGADHNSLRWFPFCTTCPIRDCNVSTTTWEERRKVNDQQMNDHMVGWPNVAKNRINPRHPYLYFSLMGKWWTNGMGQYPMPIYTTKVSKWQLGHLITRQWSLPVTGEINDWVGGLFLIRGRSPTMFGAAILHCLWFPSSLSGLFHSFVLSDK